MGMKTVGARDGRRGLCKPRTGRHSALDRVQSGPAPAQSRSPASS